MSELPTRETVAGYSSVDFEDQQNVLDAYASGRLVDRKGIGRHTIEKIIARRMVGSTPAGVTASTRTQIRKTADDIIAAIGGSDEK